MRRVGWGKTEEWVRNGRQKGRDRGDRWRGRAKGRETRERQM